MFREIPEQIYSVKKIVLDSLVHERDNTDNQHYGN